MYKYFPVVQTPTPSKKIIYAQHKNKADVQKDNEHVQRQR